jgi:hypothetical protein
MSRLLCRRPPTTAPVPIRIRGNIVALLPMVAKSSISTHPAIVAPGIGRDQEKVTGPAAKCDVSESNIGAAFQRQDALSKRHGGPVLNAPTSRPILQDFEDSAVFGLVRFWAETGQKCQMFHVKHFSNDSKQDRMGFNVETGREEERI